VVEETQFRKATLNINDVKSRTNIGMLAEFLREQDIDVMLVFVFTISYGQYMGIY
jgi:hypothetical protein